MEAYIHGTAPEEQARLALLNQLTNPAFHEFLNIQPTDRVLEIGSGLGIFAAELAGKYPNAQITGIEISADQLAQAPTHFSNLNFVLGNAKQLPFEDNSFDVVYGRYILEHIQQPEFALQEARRVLRSTGRIFFQENAIEFVYFYPECPTFKVVWHKFLALQSQLGGDGMIGIKLHYLLHHAGFEQIELSIAPEIHSPENEKLIPWTENIIGNIKSGAAALIENHLASSSEITQAIDELEQLKSQNDASAYFYWNRATARKAT